MTVAFGPTSCIAPLPHPERGRAFPLGWDPVRESILYPHGKSIYIRSIHSPDQCEIYEEHTSTTTVAKVSPSGHYVASGDVSGELRVWALSNPDKIFTLKYAGKVLPCPIRDLSWDAESSRIAVVGTSSGTSSSGDNRLGLVVTFDTGNKVGELLGHTKTVNSVAFDPSGKRPLFLATASDDGRVNTYRGTPMKFEASHDHHASRFIHSVVYSPDGSSFVTVGSDGTAQLHDGKTGEWIAQLFHIAGASIYSVAWNPAGKQVWFGCADGTGRLVDVGSKKVIQEVCLSASTKAQLDRQAVSILWVHCASIQGSRILSLSASGQLFILGPASSDESLFQVVSSIQGHTQSVVELQVTAGNVLITRDNDDVLCMSEASDHYWSSSSLSLEGKATRCIANLGSFTYRVLEDATVEKLAKDGKIVGSWTLPVKPTRLIFLAGGEAEVLIATEKALYVYDLTGGSVKRKAALPTTVTCISYHADTRSIAAGCDDGTLYILSSENLDICTLKKISSSELTCTAVRAHANNSILLAVGDANRTIRLYEWNSSTLTTLIEHEWVFHSSRMTGLAWLQDGSGRLASIALDQRLMFWNPTSPSSPVFTQSNAHSNSMSGLVALRDQNCVVTSSLDGSLRFWRCP